MSKIIKGRNIIDFRIFTEILNKSGWRRLSKSGSLERFSRRLGLNNIQYGAILKTGHRKGKRAISSIDFYKSRKRSYILNFVTNPQSSIPKNVRKKISSEIDRALKEV